MCGIAGFFDPRGKTSYQDLSLAAKAMADSIAYRGPDDEGVWVDENNGIALSHRRLSIVDLSSSGAQPMESACGRYLIVYNGEVYNCEELRHRLTDISFKGYSDTEVILESIARFGLLDTIKKLIGMFAFALWDKHKKCLHLVRDRLGIKPLYWGKSNGVYLFGSELKAVSAHPTFDATIDRGSIASYLRHNYIPGPHSIYKNIQKLKPGFFVTIQDGVNPKEECFWDFQKIIKTNELNRQRELEDDQAVKELDQLLRDSIKRRMIADVPLGAFLSGGIDSSTVVALMQEQSLRPIKSFSIGFNNQEYNEAQHAAKIANHLKTDHTELYVDYREAQDIVPNLSTIFDEPFADSSQIPTLLVSQMTKKEVTVALSGDGGDEIFAGYNRYTFSSDLWNRISIIPKPLRKIISSSITSISPKKWDTISSYTPKFLQRPQMGDKLHKLAGILNGEPETIYRSIISHWQSPSDIMIGGNEHYGPLFDNSIRELIPNQIERMQYLDTITYLPDDILTKVDRASMAVSLEARVPLLDHRVVEFAWRLPMKFKLRNGEAKWILRQVLDQYIPRNLTDRPKMGFGVPIGDWLRGPLRDWAEALITEKKLKEQGFFNPVPIHEKWREHISGHRNWQYALWTILMFQSWLENKKF